jgi:hypothetical protein
LTDAEKKASRIADNKTAESAWIDDALETEIDVLAQDDSIDMESLGFDDEEIDDLLQPDDALPEPAEEEALELEAEYEVIIECNDELEQERVYDELTTEGYECRLNSL